MKWEYEATKLGITRENEGRGIQLELEYYGDQGWELVSVSETGESFGEGGHVYWVFFKRPKSESDAD
jgi:hypothetical protein